MALFEVGYDELVEVRRALVDEINKRLTGDERNFLVSFKEKVPKWDLLGVEGAQDMPAVKWKLANLEEMNDDKHKKSVQQLKRVIAKD